VFFIRGYTLRTVFKLRDSKLLGIFGVFIYFSPVCTQVELFALLLTPRWGVRCFDFVANNRTTAAEHAEK